MGPRKAAAAPKRRAQAKKKPAAKKNTLRNRPRLDMGNVMDPLYPRPVPTLMVQGHALPVTGVTTKGATLNTLTFVRAVLAVTNTGNSGVIMSLLANNNGTISREKFTVPLMASDHSGGGPTTGRAMKWSLDIMNSSPAINRGGRVWVLQTDQRLTLATNPDALDAASLNLLCEQIVTHPHTVEQNGNNFTSKKPYRLLGGVNDQPTYERFSDWQLAVDVTVDVFWASLGVWPNLAVQPRPMSSVFLVFDPVAFNQEYTFLARGTWYARYPLTTLPGQMHTPVPTAKPETVNKVLATGGTR